jgi:methylthioribose-1-phosphate isomerase
MKVDGLQYRTIWADTTYTWVEVIDQTRLPHAFETRRLESPQSVIHAIKTMQVRGAPLIGAAAAYGIALAMREDALDAHLEQTAQDLIASRPTAVNLRWAVERMVKMLKRLPTEQRNAAAWAEAAAICEEDVKINQAIGQHGLKLIEAQIEVQRRMQDKAPGAQQRDSTQMHGEAASTAQRSQASSMQFNILTHCNAGWLAAVDWGTALAPIYAAHDAGLNIHVWVDETRPRNQGGSLTAWELGKHGIPHTVITDNAGGHYMQHGLVDMVIVGADRVTRTGDVCNKIGTYLKALAAFDNSIPFYAAVPSPTIDWEIEHGLAQIPIEERSPDEVAWVQGRLGSGEVACVNVLPENSSAANPAFDVTPARLVTGIITERGICRPQELVSLFGD